MRSYATVVALGITVFAGGFFWFCSSGEGAQQERPRPLEDCEVVLPVGAAVDSRSAPRVVSLSSSRGSARDIAVGWSVTAVADEVASALSIRVENLISSYPGGFWDVVPLSEFVICGSLISDEVVVGGVHIPHLAGCYVPSGKVYLAADIFEEAGGDLSRVFHHEVAHAVLAAHGADFNLARKWRELRSVVDCVLASELAYPGWKVSDYDYRFRPFGAATRYGSLEWDEDFCETWALWMLGHDSVVGNDLVLAAKMHLVKRSYQMTLGVAKSPPCLPITPTVARLLSFERKLRAKGWSRLDPIERDFVARKLVHDSNAEGLMEALCSALCTSRDLWGSFVDDVSSFVSLLRLEAGGFLGDRGQFLVASALDDIRRQTAVYRQRLAITRGGKWVSREVSDESFARIGEILDRFEMIAAR